MSARLRFAYPALTALGLVMSMGLGANAADMALEEPPTPAEVAELPVASWAGAYAGLTAGYGFAGRAQDDITGTEVDTDGFVGGAFAGYNFDTGSPLVAGIEGDVGYNGIEGSSGGIDVDGGIEGSFRARLGYSVSPDILLYGTAGGAAKHMSVSAGGIEDSDTAFGWTAGAGTDIKITQNMFARGEYRYSDYGSETFNTGGGALDVDSRDHRVQFGVGFHF